MNESSPLEIRGESARVKAAAKGACNTPDSLTAEPFKEAHWLMPESNSGSGILPAHFLKNGERGFEPLGAVIARLKVGIEAAYHDDPEAAADLHDDLIAVEHEQRLLSDVRRLGA